MTNLPDFIFATGTRVLRASGAMTPVTFDNALDEAKRAGSAVVGLIPVSYTHLTLPTKA